MNTTYQIHPHGRKECFAPKLFYSFSNYASLKMSLKSQTPRKSANFWQYIPKHVYHTTWNGCSRRLGTDTLQPVIWPVPFLTLPTTVTHLPAPCTTLGFLHTPCTRAAELLNLHLRKVLKRSPYDTESPLESFTHVLCRIHEPLLRVAKLLAHVGTPDG